MIMLAKHRLLDHHHPGQTHAPQRNAGARGQEVFPEGRRRAHRIHAESVIIYNILT